MIVILCHGNRYRSVVCEAVLREYGFEVTSAGFREGGSMAAKPVRSFLRNLGLNVEAHRSRQVNSSLLDEASLIVYMDAGNAKRLRQMNPAYLDKSVCLAKYLNRTTIPDPAFVSNPVRFKQIMDDIVVATQKLAADMSLQV